MPLKIKLTRAYKNSVEQFAKEDGVQRGVFFDTSGNMRCERVSATALYPYVWKTKNGKPFHWKKKGTP